MIAVLGMHRSGTSALVGSLQQRGLFLGRHSTHNTYNLRGNRENPDVMLLNEDILERSGGSWRAPPAAVEWAPDHVERAHAILAEHAERPLWGFKDPRTLLTLDGWLRLVPDLEFVGVFRHPARVARSLASRPSLPVEDPVELWRVLQRAAARAASPQRVSRSSASTTTPTSWLGTSTASRSCSGLAPADARTSHSSPMTCAAWTRSRRSCRPT